MVELSRIFSTFRTVLKAILLSLGWNLFSVLAGLLQLGLIIVFALFSGKQVGIDKILKDGIFLFFCTAFLSGSIIDFLFTKKRYPKIFYWLFIYIFPSALILFIAVLYIEILGLNGEVEQKEIGQNMVLYGTYICFMLTLGHSLIYRSLSFYFRREG
jgi:hypothetical protein